MSCLDYFPDGLAVAEVWEQCEDSAFVNFLCYKSDLNTLLPSVLHVHLALWSFEINGCYRAQQQVLVCLKFMGS